MICHYVHTPVQIQTAIATNRVKNTLFTYSFFTYASIYERLSDVEEEEFMRIPRFLKNYAIVFEEKKNFKKFFIVTSISISE